jgi:hypothetical protein
MDLDSTYMGSTGPSKCRSGGSSSLLQWMIDVAVDEGTGFARRRAIEVKEMCRQACQRTLCYIL